jgi:hypothetical protein
VRDVLEEHVDTVAVGYVTKGGDAKVSVKVQQGDKAVHVRQVGD